MYITQLHPKTKKMFKPLIFFGGKEVPVDHNHRFYFLVGEPLSTGLV